MVSMATLRPNPELWRAHRLELADPWVGPGAARNEVMVRRVANDQKKKQRLSLQYWKSLKATPIG